MLALSDFVEKETAARVAMPSYDGVLLQQHPEQFEWSGDLQARWKAVCEKKWKFVFPVERKNYLEHLPPWMAEVLKLRALVASASE